MKKEMKWKAEYFVEITNSGATSLYFGGCQRFCPAKMRFITSKLATVFCDFLAFVSNSIWSSSPGSTLFHCTAIFALRNDKFSRLGG